MRPEGTVVAMSTNVNIGDKIPCGRGPWTPIIDIQTVNGRRPADLPPGEKRLALVTRRGERIVRTDQPVRVLRAPISVST